MLLFYILINITLLLAFYPIKTKIAIYEFDLKSSIAIKGVCSLLIILHHLSMVIDYNPHNYTFNFSQFNSWGSLIVGVFFFISGFGLTKNVTLYNNPIKSLSKRLYKVLLPLIITSLIYLTLIYIFDEINIQNFMLPNSWYCYTIMFYYIVFFLSIMITTNKLKILSINIVISLFFVLYLIYNDCSGYLFKSNLAFNLGMVYAIFESKICNYIIHKKNNYIITLIVIFNIIAIIDIAINYILNFSFPIGNYLFSIACCVFIFSITLIYNLNSKILLFLGSISYELYLIHGTIIFFLTQVFPINDIVLIFTTFLLSLIISYLIRHLVRFILKFTLKN